MEKLNLLNDQALCEDDPKYTDGLGFETYARVLAGTAAGTNGPFTIGIFGEWGTGKTSLMRLIETMFSENDNIITVWFNAWRYEQEEHPIVPLVGTIVKELEKHKSFLAKIKDGGHSLLKALRAVAYGFSAKSKVKIPGFAEIEASFVAKDMIDRSDSLTPDPLLDRSLYYQSFEALSAVDFPQGTRIIVLIDDLDRCFPDLAIKLLESIKLVLSQKGFIFILGVARRVIEGYLQHRYEKEYGIKDFQGNAYFDKMVQLPFHIPPHTGRMKKFSKAILKKVEYEIRKELEEIVPIMGEALGGNPRSIIRFVNNILIDLAIYDELVKKGILDNLPVKYFAVSRSLELRWPKVFSLLTASDKLAESITDWDNDTINRIKDSDDEEISKFASLLIGDLELQTLLKTKHGQDWLRLKTKRDASVQFLESQRQESKTESRDASLSYDIFFSYSYDDKTYVYQIAEVLTNEGVKVFMDKDVSPGEKWVEALNEALSKTKAICFFISPSSVESEFVLREINVALLKQMQDAKYKIVPIMLPGSDFNQLPDELKEYQALDLRSGIDPEKIKQLAQMLKKS